MRRVARRYLLPGLGIVFVLVFLRASCAATPRSPFEISVAQQSAACREVQAGAKRMLEQQGADDAGPVSRGIGKQCREAPRAAVTPTETPVPPAPGCEATVGKTLAKPLTRRTLTVPVRPLPFFASRPGRLPKDGTATVGGVQLPRGSRCLHHWATDEPVPDAIAVASKLATAFPRTGLWPVLWDASYGDPDNSMLADGDPRAVDRLDAIRIMRKRLASLDGDVPPLPGLAPGAKRPARKAQPYATLARQTPPQPGLPPTRYTLLLVPVNRPADVPSALGTNLTQYLTSDETSAILRSWEERFGAVPVVLGPGDLELAAGAPATTSKQARQLVYEQYAFNPEDELATFEDLPAVAERLRSDKPDAASYRSSGLWGFGWAD